MNELLAFVTWKKCSTETYKDCAHEYIVRRDFLKVFDEMARLIDENGTYYEWRGGEYKYYVDDGYAYWHMGIIINRTYETALDNKGFPDEAESKRIYERFWGGGKK